MSTIRVITARVNETRSRLMASVGSPNDEILDNGEVRLGEMAPYFRPSCVRVPNEDIADDSKLRLGEMAPYFRPRNVAVTRNRDEDIVDNGKVRLGEMAPYF